MVVVLLAVVDATGDRVGTAALRANENPFGVTTRTMHAATATSYDVTTPTEHRVNRDAMTLTEHRANRDVTTLTARRVKLAAMTLTAHRVNRDVTTLTVHHRVKHAAMTPTARRRAATMPIVNPCATVTTWIAAASHGAANRNDEAPAPRVTRVRWHEPGPGSGRGLRTGA